MKAKEIRDLIDFISSTGLEEVNIETDEFKIKVKRSNDVRSQSAPVVAAQASAPSAGVATPLAVSGSAKESPSSSSSNLIEIKSPMIGTFYRSPNPDSPNFIEEGDSVKPGDAVCIIEAMKLFNEIESEISGKIVKILVENATPVEYDQTLFLVDPS